MAQGLFQQLVWDETSQSFVTHNTKEINPIYVSRLVWNGESFDFYMPSGGLYTYIMVVDSSLPELTGLYYNNIKITEPVSYNINGDFTITAYYGAEPNILDISNKIATMTDLNNLSTDVNFVTSNLTNCPTLGTIKNLTKYTTDYVYRIYVSGSYTDNQLVRLSNCRVLKESRSYTITIRSVTLQATGIPDQNGWYSNGGVYTKSYTVPVKFYAGSQVVKESSISLLLYGTQKGSSIIVATYGILGDLGQTFATTQKITKIELVQSQIGFQSGNIVQIDAANQGKDWTWSVNALIVC